MQLSVHKNFPKGINKVPVIITTITMRNNHIFCYSIQLPQWYVYQLLLLNCNLSATCNLNDLWLYMFNVIYYYLLYYTEV